MFFGESAFSVTSFHLSRSGSSPSFRPGSALTLCEPLIIWSGPGKPPPSRFRRAQVASAAAAKVRSKRSGNRVWPLTPPAYAASTVPVALAEVQRLFLPDAHTPQHGVNAASPHVVTDQVLIKVTKTGDGDQCPTPEGIHQDGSEVSAVTMIKRDRVTSGGETRLWSLDATTGNYCANLASTPSTRPDTP